MFTLTSTDVVDGGIATRSLLFNKEGCTGDNRSPQLSWAGEPEGTRSFAITLHDPDAPVKGGWWHWFVFDLLAGTHELHSGAGDGTGRLLPRGAKELMNDSGERGYGGPCPPKGHGVHHYHLSVHALRVAQLGFGSSVSTPHAWQAVVENTLASAKLVFLCER